MNKAEKTAFHLEANKSVLHFGLAFAPEAFSDPFSPDIHWPMAELIDRPAKIKAGAAPRGVGKSTIGNTINLVRRAATCTNRYMLLLSNTLEQAIEHLNPIKKQFTENERIIEIYGEQKGPVWREDMIVLKNGTKIRALGIGQQVRGRREGLDRPDYALGDDMESSELVGSESALKRARLWVANDLRNSLDRHRGEEMYWGTVLSADSILEDLLGNPQVASVRLELFDGNYKSRWPEVYPDSRIQEMKKMAEFDGNLDGFWADYRNIPTSAENQKFQRSWFKTWGPDLDWAAMSRYLIIDPAKTTNNCSDYTAMHVLGLPYTGEVYDLDYDMDRQVNEAMYDKVVRMCQKWNIHQVFVETNGLDKYITDPMQKYLNRNGIKALVRGIHATGHKDDRIQALIPLYKMGQVYHSAERHTELEDQLLLHPRSKFDDVADCFSYCVYLQTLLNRGRYSKANQIYRGDYAKLSRHII